MQETKYCYVLERPLTKSEKRLLKLISQTDNFTSSITEMCYLLNLSVPTICKSLARLVKLGLLKKQKFLIGAVPRCRYEVTKKLSTFKDKDVIVESIDKSCVSEFDGIKKESVEVEHFLPSNISEYNMINDNDIYNINNNIYQSNQSYYTDTVGDCQEENSKKIKKLPKGVVNDDLIDDLMNDLFSSSNENNMVKHFFNKILKKMWKEKNNSSKTVIKFVSTGSKDDIKDVLQSVINRLCNRMLDTTKGGIKNIQAYIRTAIVNAVNNFNENSLKSHEFFNCCKELINNTTKKEDGKKGKFYGFFGKRESFRDFEQREYDENFFSSFYHNACLEGGV